MSNESEFKHFLSELRQSLNSESKESITKIDSIFDLEERKEYDVEFIQKCLNKFIKDKKRIEEIILALYNYDSIKSVDIFPLKKVYKHNRFLIDKLNEIEKQ